MNGWRKVGETKVFIEVHHGEIKILVRVERISYLYDAGEKTTIAFGGGKWITADESYDEIVALIRGTGADVKPWKER